MHEDVPSHRAADRARLHGDLWNGNVLWGVGGTVHVLDPAAYGGHREVDLAMLSLFGLPHLRELTDAEVAAMRSMAWSQLISR